MEPLIKETLEPSGSYMSRAATMADIPELVDLANERSRGLYGENDETLGNWTAAWQSPGLDLERDTRVLVDAQGKIVAEAELWDIQPLHVWKHMYWCVRRGYETPEIGGWALGWLEERARERINLAPEGARVVISTRIPEIDRFWAEVCLAGGCQPVRRMDRMRMALPEAPGPLTAPDGISIHAVRDEDELNQFYFALWEAFEDHWGHVPEPFKNYADRMRVFVENDPDMGPAMCLLALSDGQPAGAALCRRDAFGEPGLGWVNMLGVRRDWRKRGLGKALLLHSFDLLHSIGMSRVGLDVDSESLTGAPRLYQSVGLSTVRCSITYLKELRPGADFATQHV